jgi:transcription elongation factor Elf1
METLPCPFCGSNNVEFDNHNSKYFFAYCGNCGAAIGNDIHLYIVKEIEVEI